MTRDKITVEVKQDDEPLNPRKDFDNAGQMYCWHRRYDLGDKKPEGYTPEDFEAQYNANNAIIIPLYLYDHSGITMRTGNFRSIDPQGWDSGQVGWIFITLEDMKKEGWDIEHATKYLKGEVKTYDQYLTGDVYHYTVKKTTVCKHCGEEKTVVIDSCGGFFGDDVKTNGMLEYIPKKYRKQLLEAKVS